MFKICAIYLFQLFFYSHAQYENQVTLHDYIKHLCETQNSDRTYEFIIDTVTKSATDQSQLSLVVYDSINGYLTLKKHLHFFPIII